MNTYIRFTCSSVICTNKHAFVWTEYNLWNTFTFPSGETKFQIRVSRIEFVNTRWTASPITNQESSFESSSGRETESKQEMSREAISALAAAVRRPELLNAVLPRIYPSETASRQSRKRISGTSISSGTGGACHANFCTAAKSLRVLSIAAVGSSYGFS